jgi:hypothetical protein
MSSKRHPSSAVLRQRESDLAHLLEATRDYSERQAAIFVLVNRTILSLPSTGLERFVDGDVAEAAAALAGTLETASRGVIYEQRPRSLPAARLVETLRPVISRAVEGGGSSFERDAAVVMRGIERLARTLHGEDHAQDAGDGYLGFVRRTIGAAEIERGVAPDTPRLILP